MYGRCFIGSLGFSAAIPHHGVSRIQAENQQRAMEAAEKHNAKVLIPKALMAGAVAPRGEGG